MPLKPALTDVQLRILSDARNNDGVIVCGLQRRPVNRLRGLGLVMIRTAHVRSVSVHGRDQITVSITRDGSRYLSKPLPVKHD